MLHVDDKLFLLVASIFRIRRAGLCRLASQPRCSTNHLVLLLEDRQEDLGLHLLLDSKVSVDLFKRTVKFSMSSAIENLSAWLRRWLATGFRKIIQLAPIDKVIRCMWLMANLMNNQSLLMVIVLFWPIFYLQMLALEPLEDSELLHSDRPAPLEACLGQHRTNLVC